MIRIISTFLFSLSLISLSSNIAACYSDFKAYPDFGSKNANDVHHLKLNLKYDAHVPTGFENKIKQISGVVNVTPESDGHWGTNLFIIYRGDGSELQDKIIQLMPHAKSNTYSFSPYSVAFLDKNDFDDEDDWLYS